MKQTEKVHSIIYQYVTNNGKDYIGFGGSSKANSSVRGLPLTVTITQL